MSLIYPATKHTITKASMFLRTSKLVAFPTETVYGLGANAGDDIAVARIFEAKGRPSFNPLIVHFSSIEAASAQVEFTDTALALANAFWPGPLTLVLRRSETCTLSLLVSAGLDTVAVRIPAHPTAQSLLHETTIPIAAPSANRSGTISPTTADHVAKTLEGHIDMILDAGPCPIGIESTVIDCSTDTPTLLRPGGITGEELNKVVRVQSTESSETSNHQLPITNHHTELRSPGLLVSHYAPSLPVRLNVTQPQPTEALIAFGPDVPTGSATIINLSKNSDLTEAAANPLRHIAHTRRHNLHRHRRHAYPQRRALVSPSMTALRGRLRQNLKTLIVNINFTYVKCTLASRRNPCLTAGLHSEF